MERGFRSVRREIDHFAGELHRMVTAQNDFEGRLEKLEEKPSSDRKAS
jgi:hypothetical protein